MKPFLILTLFLLALTACAPVVNQPMPLPAVDVPPGFAPGVTMTPQVKVVEMATQTAVEGGPAVPGAPAATVVATLPPLGAATAYPGDSTPVSEATSTAAAPPKTLKELGVPATTYEDKVAGLAVDYPAAWEINALPDDIRVSSTAYTASLRSPKKPSAPKFQDGIPPDMAAIDLTVVSDGAKTFEQAVVERRASATTNEVGQPVKVVRDEEWMLPSGLSAHRFVYNLGKDPISGYGDRDKMSVEVVTVINGKMVLIVGYGDLSLFDVVAGSLRKIE